MPLVQYYLIKAEDETIEFEYFLGFDGDDNS